MSIDIMDECLDIVFLRGAFSAIETLKENDNVSRVRDFIECAKEELANFQNADDKKIIMGMITAYQLVLQRSCEMNINLSHKALTHAIAVQVSIYGVADKWSDFNIEKTATEILKLISEHNLTEVTKKHFNLFVGAWLAKQDFLPYKVI